MARAFDLGVTSWGALGAGILTGKYRRDGSGEGRAALWDQIEEKKLDIADEVVKIAAEVGRPPSQVALNWVRQQPGLILPMIGATTVAQLKDNLACLEFSLTDEQLQHLDEVSRIELGFPHDFLVSDEVKDLLFGGTYDKIDKHRD